MWSVLTIARVWAGQWSYVNLEPMNSDIAAFFAPFFAQAREDLAALVALQSVSAQGRNLAETAGAVRALLEAEGFVVAAYPGLAGGPILIAEAGPQGHTEGQQHAVPTLLVYNHYDVQPEAPLALWDSPPFVLTERAGHLYGRGVADDKGEFVARLAAVRALRAQHGGQLPLKLKWLIEGEEEVGSPSLASFVAEHAPALAADACLWEAGGVDASGRLVLYAGLKGIICLELRAKVAESDLHSSLGAVVDNPIYRLAKAIASMRDEHGQVTIAGFYDGVRQITEADRAAIATIPDESAAIASNYGIKGFFVPAGEAFYERLLLQPALNVNGLHGGYGDPGSKTVLPATAFAKLDLRLVPDQQPERVLALLKQHLVAHNLADIEVIELESHEEPARSDLGHPFVQLAVAVAREVYGSEPVLYPSMGGSGPMHPFIEHLGVPVVGTGVGYVATRIHAPNENIRIADFERGIIYAYRLFEQFGKR
jgi:acetylornithine deacetylase/succinyl-diaminopimelate desuccinylase-like protein